MQHSFTLIVCFHSLVFARCVLCFPFLSCCVASFRFVSFRFLFVLVCVCVVCLSLVWFEPTWFLFLVLSQLAIFDPSIILVWFVLFWIVRLCLCCVLVTSSRVRCIALVSLWSVCGMRASFVCVLLLFCSLWLWFHSYLCVCV